MKPLPKIVLFAAVDVLHGCFVLQALLASKCDLHAAAHVLLVALWSSWLSRICYACGRELPVVAVVPASILQ